MEDSQNEAFSHLADTSLYPPFFVGYGAVGGLGAKPPIKNGCAVGTPFAPFSQFSTYPQVETCSTKVI